jgi:hypothetical protein
MEQLGAHPTMGYALYVADDDDSTKALAALGGSHDDVWVQHVRDIPNQGRDLGFLESRRPTPVLFDLKTSQTFRGDEFQEKIRELTQTKTKE